MTTAQENVVTLPLPEMASPTVTGTVAAVSGDSATIAIPGMRVNAKKAFSCFADPLPGDTVICCRDENGRFFILGILERNGTEKLSITYPADTAITSRRGSITIASPKRVTMVSESLNFLSGEAIHKSASATIAFQDLTATGNTFQARYGTVRLISNLINTMARQVIDRFRGYTRQTEGHDQVKAGQATRSVKGLYSVDSKHTIMVSREVTKIDGEKILMG